MKPTWIIQRNFNTDFHKWIVAFEESDSLYHNIDIIPFADELPKVELQGPSVCYGSTTLIKNAKKSGYGVFFNEENFRPSLWNRMYGHNMFNYDGCVRAIKDVEIIGEAFVRPNSDLKDFSGSMVNGAGFEKFQKEVAEGGYPFDSDTEIFIAPLKDIYKEWRVFIVNGKVVTASQYRLRTMLAKKAGAPKEVLDFAQKMSDVWSPEKAFVMDICSDNNEKLHILELNCFNASGIYYCDVPAIIRAVEGLYE